MKVLKDLIYPGRESVLKHLIFLLTKRKVEDFPSLLEKWDWFTFPMLSDWLFYQNTIDSAFSGPESYLSDFKVNAMFPDVHHLLFPDISSYFEFLIHNLLTRVRHEDETQKLCELYRKSTLGSTSEITRSEHVVDIIFLSCCLATAWCTRHSRLHEFVRALNTLLSSGYPAKIRWMSSEVALYIFPNVVENNWIERSPQRLHHLIRTHLKYSTDRVLSERDRLLEAVSTLCESHKDEILKYIQKEFDPTVATVDVVPNILPFLAHVDEPFQETCSKIMQRETYLQRQEEFSKLPTPLQYRETLIRCAIMEKWLQTLDTVQIWALFQPFLEPTLNDTIGLALSKFFDMVFGESSNKKKDD